jgi:hypothetical protein
MPDTYAVRLPKAKTPRFPPICVGCSGEPTTEVRLWSEAIGWWSVLRGGGVIGLALGKRVRVPACEPCARRIRRSRLLRGLVMWALLIAGGFIGLWLFREWDGLARRLAVIGIAIVAALPYLAWELMFPPAVDIVVTSDHVRFLFTDRAYAQKFADENDA